MPPFCEEHGRYHDRTFECYDMRRDEAIRREDAARREKADRIADDLIDTYADATTHPDDLQLVRGLLADAALAALKETENAR